MRQGADKKYWCGALSEAYPEEIGELFSFHSKDWWRHLWEKTEIAIIAACYDMENAKEIWMPWAEWSRDNMPEIGDDVQFLADDVNNDLALIVMAAVKK